MPTRAYDKGTPVFKGTSKIANRATKTNKDGVYKIRQPLGSYKDFMIVDFKKGTAEDIYAELQLYYEFGQKGISPMIYFVKLPDVKEPVTLSKFARLYRDKHVIPESYLVEKSNCGNVILEYYGSSHMLMFSNLRRFLEEKIVGNGYVNTDIKIANLCIDGMGNFLLIDLDPNFIQQVQSSGRKDDYVNYMLFQVYCNLCISGKMVFSINDLNAIVRNYDLRQMIERLYSFKVGDKKEYTHPLSNLLWYSGIQIRKRFSYSDVNEFYNDIIKALTSLPKIPSAEIPSAKIPSAEIPTAEIPTAEIPFSGFSSEDEPTMMMHNDQESTTAESPTPNFYTPSISTSGIPSLRMSSASDYTPFTSNSSFGSNSFKWGGHKKTKRRIPKKRSMKRRRMRK
jgi:hypothetical protein